MTWVFFPFEATSALFLNDRTPAQSQVFEVGGKGTVTKACRYVTRLEYESPYFANWFFIVLSQWLTFKLLGITYLVGRIKFELLFQCPKWLISLQPTPSAAQSVEFFAFFWGDFHTKGQQPSDVGARRVEMLTGCWPVVLPRCGIPYTPEV